MSFSIFLINQGSLCPLSGQRRKNPPFFLHAEPKHPWTLLAYPLSRWLSIHTPVISFSVSERAIARFFFLKNRPSEPALPTLNPRASLPSEEIPFLAPSGFENRTGGIRRPLSPSSRRFLFNRSSFFLLLKLPWRPFVVWSITCPHPSFSSMPWGANASLVALLFRRSHSLTPLSY